MVVIRETSSIPVGYFSRPSGPAPSHIADTIAEDLQIGEYLIKYRIRPVIFLRIANWRENLSVCRFNPRESGSIILSDYREVILMDDELEYYFTDDVDHCRIVLIGDEGYSSFKVKFD